MDLFVGLDVSVRMTGIRVMDLKGKVLNEAKVKSRPQAIASLLGSLAGQGWRRPLSQWLYSGLAAAGYPIICVETRHMTAALSAQINKTDRNDARGIAQMMRIGLFRPVHVKTERSQGIRMLLTARNFLQSKIIDAENNLRGVLRNFGLKVGAVTRPQSEARVIDLIKERPYLAMAIAPLSEVRRVLREQYQCLHKAMERLAADDGICRLLMTAPGVGPLVSLTFRAGIDEAARFSRSRSVPAHCAPTPARCQSGKLDRGRGISRCGGSGVRWALVEAAGIIMRQRTESAPSKVWGMVLAKRRGPAKAPVALARRLATILHRMWIDNTDHRRQAQSASRHWRISLMA